MFLDVYGECRDSELKVSCFATDFCKPVGMAHHFYLYKLNHT